MNFKRKPAHHGTGSCSDQTPQTHDFKSRREYLETVRSDGGGVVVFRFRHGQGFLNHIGSVGRRPTRKKLRAHCPLGR